jgi:hypothetical protein
MLEAYTSSKFPLSYTGISEGQLFGIVVAEICGRLSTSMSFASGVLTITTDLGVEGELSFSESVDSDHSSAATIIFANQVE